MAPTVIATTILSIGLCAQCALPIYHISAHVFIFIFILNISSSDHPHFLFIYFLCIPIVVMCLLFLIFFSFAIPFPFQKQQRMNEKKIHTQLLVWLNTIIIYMNKSTYLNKYTTPHIFHCNTISKRRRRRIKKMKRNQKIKQNKKLKERNNEKIQCQNWAIEWMWKVRMQQEQIVLFNGLKLAETKTPSKHRETREECLAF